LYKTCTEGNKFDRLKYLFTIFHISEHREILFDTEQGNISGIKIDNSIRRIQ